MYIYILNGQCSKVQILGCRACAICTLYLKILNVGSLSDGCKCQTDF